MSSVLTKYQRTPKIYIKLPSGGKYYKVDSIEMSLDNTLPIRAMTARDELLLKSPDALLNGESILNMIKSCCPEIKFKAKNLIAPDVEAILLAIFHASYGDNLEFDSECPECKHKNTFGASIAGVLHTVKMLEPPYIIKEKIELPDNNGKTVEHIIKLYLKPCTYGTMTKKSLKDFENAKMIQNLSSSTLDEEEKLTKFSESIEKMANYNFDMVSDVIEKIVVPAENPTEDHKVDEVSNEKEIKDFIFQADSKLIAKINKMAGKINETGINKDFKAECQNKECKHTWTTNIEFDPTNFFAVDSSH